VPVEANPDNIAVHFASEPTKTGSGVHEIVTDPPVVCVLPVEVKFVVEVDELPPSGRSPIVDRDTSTIPNPIIRNVTMTRTIARTTAVLSFFNKHSRLLSLLYFLFEMMNFTSRIAGQSLLPSCFATINQKSQAMRPTTSRTASQRRLAPEKTNALVVYSRDKVQREWPISSSIIRKISLRFDLRKQQVKTKLDFFEL
jgi:hypothetical protein